MIDILATPLDRLVQILQNDYGKGRYHAEAMYREVCKYGNPDVLKAPEFKRSPRLASALSGKISVRPGQVEKIFKEENLTKFITRLSDGLKIESVIIPMTGHNTLCVSSQVGCRMGCAFCETAKLGFKRNLTVAEITGQLFNARHVLQADVKNLVFMGMGEPLDNFEAVTAAIGVMNAQKGFDVALRHMTLSTAGLVPGINRLADLNMAGVRLAVSVNAPDDTVRSRLMPVNNRWNMGALKESLRHYPLGKRGVFLFEYILIKGVNDSREQARQLAEFIRLLPVRLNLIPYNPIRAFAHESPSDGDMHAFADWLTAAGVFVIKRWSRGRSVSAGCGQLGRDLIEGDLK